MKKIISFALVALVSMSANVSFGADSVFEGGFEEGSEYTITPYMGDVEIHCPHTTIRRHRCVEYTASPAWESHFLAGPSEADHVEFVTTHEDGKTTKKKEGYDGVAGRTEDRVNLFVTTLFQKPLLRLGNNHVHYTLTKKRTEISSGDLDVVVKRGARHYCPRRVYYEPSDSPCREPRRQCHIYFGHVHGQCRP